MDARVKPAHDIVLVGAQGPNSAPLDWQPPHPTIAAC